MNEEHLIGVFRKALVASRSRDEESLGRAVQTAEVDDVRFFLDEITRCDNLLRNEWKLRALAQQVLAPRKSPGEP